MDNGFISDIVDDVKIKPSRYKSVLKWVVRVSVMCVAAAFVVGQYNVIHKNEINKLEEELIENKKVLSDLKKELDDNVVILNNRIDKIYDDGYSAFESYQEYNKKNFELLIDFNKGNINEEVVKKMLDISVNENSKKVDNAIKKSKLNSKSIGNDKNYISITKFTPVGSSDTIYYVLGASQKYINLLDSNIYKINKKTKNKNNDSLYDIFYSKIN